MAIERQLVGVIQSDAAKAFFNRDIMLQGIHGIEDEFGIKPPNWSADVHFKTDSAPGSVPENPHAQLIADMEALLGQVKGRKNLLAAYGDGSADWCRLLLTTVQNSGIITADGIQPEQLAAIVKDTRDKYDAIMMPGAKSILPPLDASKAQQRMTVSAAPEQPKPASTSKDQKPEQKPGSPSQAQKKDGGHPTPAPHGAPQAHGGKPDGKPGQAMVPAGNRDMARPMTTIQVTSLPPDITFQQFAAKHKTIAGLIEGPMTAISGIADGLHQITRQVQVQGANRELAQQDAEIAKRQKKLADLLKGLQINTQMYEAAKQSPAILGMMKQMAQQIYFKELDALDAPQQMDILARTLGSIAAVEDSTEMAEQTNIAVGKATSRIEELVGILHTAGLTANRMGAEIPAIRRGVDVLNQAVPLYGEQQAAIARAETVRSVHRIRQAVLGPTERIAAFIGTVPTAFLFSVAQISNQFRYFAETFPVTAAGVSTGGALYTYVNYPLIERAIAAGNWETAAFWALGFVASSAGGAFAIDMTKGIADGVITKVKSWIANRSSKNAHYNGMAGFSGVSHDAHDTHDQH